MFLEKSTLGENGLLQYFATLALVFLGVIIGQIPLTVALFYSGDISVTTASDLFNSGIDSNLMLVLIVLSFAGGLTGLYVGVRFLHRKPFMSLVTPNRRLNWNKIWFGFVLWMLLTCLFECYNYFVAPEEYHFQFAGWSYLVLILVALLFLPIQTSFEELLFRGYLMQGCARIFGYRWPAILITAILFGSLHLANPEVGAYGLEKMMVYYIGSGIILGVITLMDDSLELPLAIHAGSNIYAAVLVTYDDSALNTNALISSTTVDIDGALLAFIIIASIFIMINAFVYKWPSWKYLFKRIEFERRDESVV